MRSPQYHLYGDVYAAIISHCCCLSQRAPAGACDVTVTSAYSDERISRMRYTRATRQVSCNSVIFTDRVEVKAKFHGSSFFVKSSACGRVGLTSSFDFLHSKTRKQTSWYIDEVYRMMMINKWGVNIWWISLDFPEKKMYCRRFLRDQIGNVICCI